MRNRKKTKEKLIQELNRANQRLGILIKIFDSIHYGVFMIDKNFNVLIFNKAFYELCGVNKEEICGKKCYELLGISQCNTECCALSWIMKGEEWVEYEVERKCFIDNKTSAIYTAIPYRNDYGELEGIVISIVDITKRKEAEEYMWRMAYYDALTGLPNRRFFFERMNLAMAHAGRNKYMLGVLFCDIDGLKKVNDNLGHDKGDQVLITVAQRLQNCLRESDTVARIGGDEEVVLIDHVTRQEDVATVAKKILDLIRMPIKIDKQEVYITVSIGVALYPDDGKNIEELLKKADTAMYYVKRQGKNTFQFYNDI